MDPSQANSRESSQQAIDAEIKSLEEYTRALKLRRNALSPVSSLPPEVFAAIFSMLCLPGTSSLYGKPEQHLARLHISHVCHQWREIALDQSLLWSYVNFTSLSPSGAAEILVRAKSSPLYLEASLSSKHLDDVRFSTFRKELQTHAPHIRGLRMGATYTRLDKIFEEIVSPAPNLEYLSLFCPRKSPTSGLMMWSSIPDTLFSGSTPRLSCLELSLCNISWKSPLLKRLKHLEILKPYHTERPELEVWLDALEEMPQLVTLTLHSASPIAPSIPFDVQRTVTLSSLARLDIYANLGDCGLAVAHLDLPALTSLSITAASYFGNRSYRDSLKTILPYVARHAHGPQDTQPLQSVLISRNIFYAKILAWPAPDIDLEMHDPPALLAMTRVALSFGTGSGVGDSDGLQILETVLVGLPLNGLVTLATHDEEINRNELHLPSLLFWRHLSPKFPLLQRVRLIPLVTHGFITMLLEDDGGREGPLLPSLKELSVVKFPLSGLSKYPVYDALRKRVELGVLMETLDLRMCTTGKPGPSFSRAKSWFLSLTEFVDVLGPKKAFKKWESAWNTLARGLFVEEVDDDGGEYDDYYSVSVPSDDEAEEFSDYGGERTG